MSKLLSEHQQDVLDMVAQGAQNAKCQGLWDSPWDIFSIHQPQAMGRAMLQARRKGFRGAARAFDLLRRPAVNFPRRYAILSVEALCGWNGYQGEKKEHGAL